MQINFSQSDTLQFTQPQFVWGQEVITSKGIIGYICGFIFYPDVADWCYGLYLPETYGGQVDEVWYSADELLPLPLIPV